MLNKYLPQSDRNALGGKVTLRDVWNTVFGRTPQEQVMNLAPQPAMVMAGRAKTALGEELSELARASGFKASGRSPQAEISGYGWGSNFANVCPKGTTASKCVSMVRDAFASTGKKYDQNVTFSVLHDLQKKGLDTSCPGCYGITQQAKAYSPSVADVGVNEYEGFLRKPVKDRIAEGNIIRDNKSTDLAPEQLGGRVEMYRDIGEHGGSVGTYTQSEDMAKIFGNTNMYINQSLSNVPGWGMNKAAAIVNRYDYPNVSNSMTAVTDKEVWELMADPNIDRGIPLHNSQKPMSYVQDEFRRKGYADYDQVRNYADYENDLVVGDKGKMVSSIKKVSVNVPDSVHKGDLKKYLASTIDSGKVPRFPQFMFTPDKQEAIEGMYKKMRTTGNPDELLSYLKKNVGKNYENVNPGYMKLVGKEWGKYGETGWYNPYNHANLNQDAIYDYWSKQSLIGNEPNKEAISMVKSKLRKYGLR